MAKAKARASKAAADEEAARWRPDGDAPAPPIFFHKEWESFGFCSNYALMPFVAPDLAVPEEDAAAAAAADEDEEADVVEAADAAAQGAPTGPRRIRFLYAEQYFAYRKALCFGDAATAAQVLAAWTPGACRAAGRRVAGFDDGVWSGGEDKDDDAVLKVRVMEDALWHKFGGAQLARTLAAAQETQGALPSPADRRAALPAAGRKLLATGDRRLVEAAPQDRYWGIGYGRAQHPLRHEADWGRNQLGRSLEATRARLRALVEGAAGSG